MMSGPFSVGKTSLVQSLLGQAFVSDYNSTKGIEVEVHKLGTLVDFRQAFWKWKQIQPKHAIKGACHVLLEDTENATFEGNCDDIQDDSNNNQTMIHLVCMQTFLMQENLKSLLIPALILPMQPTCQ
jgi:hypothetical protein